MQSEFFVHGMPNANELMYLIVLNYTITFNLNHIIVSSLLQEIDVASQPA